MVLFKHHSQGHSIPPTYHRGSKPINGIFASSTIQITAGGYLPFGTFPSDHRLLWVDMDCDVAFGYNMPPAISPAARKLNSTDPRTRKAWIQLYESFLRKHHLQTRQFTLEASITGAMTDYQSSEFEKIMRLRNQGRTYADSKCRKLRMGNVPFSLELKAARDKIELWNAIITRRKGATYSQSKIRRLEHRTGIQNSLPWKPPSAVKKSHFNNIGNLKNRHQCGELRF